MPLKTPRNKRKNTSKKRKWSAAVTQNSDALTLQQRIFTKTDPAAIASSLKRSAQKSHRRKGTPFQSAMSMLNFYINRAGHNLSKHQLDILEQAKDELRRLFHRQPAAT
ncbi:DUF3175 domain-containing protein [Deminuibacter soli]|uniref:DUF3175 domain-containing protein n=1 Tax=Deminuibacter soli TaxID=2291815 RepID=A0A3E1NJD6_9BACT|nr:DUF3175 domain-containing protein [Deminuibacter soli]RFM27898.1 DUF3175 domain-containing protein [Deminuibacter soli]